MQHLQKTGGWGVLWLTSSLLISKLQHAILILKFKVLPRTTIIFALSFHSFTNCRFSIPFVLTFMHRMGGVPLPTFQRSNVQTWDALPFSPHHPPFLVLHLSTFNFRLSTPSPVTSHQSRVAIPLSQTVQPSAPSPMHIMSGVPHFSVRGIARSCCLGGRYEVKTPNDPHCCC